MSDELGKLPKSLIEDIKNARELFDTLNPKEKNAYIAKWIIEKQGFSSETSLLAVLPKHLAGDPAFHEFMEKNFQAKCVYLPDQLQGLVKEQPKRTVIIDPEDSPRTIATKIIDITLERRETHNNGGAAAYLSKSTVSEAQRINAKKARARLASQEDFVKWLDTHNYHKSDDKAGLREIAMDKFSIGKSTFNKMLKESKTS